MNPQEITQQVKMAKIEALVKAIRAETDYMEDTVQRCHILADTDKLLKLLEA